MFKKGLLSTESISFQSGILFKELVIQYTEICKLSATSIEDTEYSLSMEKIIKHHTGLSVNLNFNSLGIGPSVTIPRVDKNHVFIEPSVRGYFDSNDILSSINASDGILKGTVSLANSKVTGVFSDVKSTINYPIGLLVNKSWTPEEHAAVTLHEIGHLFTYYEFISRSVTTNQVLSALSRGLANADGLEKKTIYLVSAMKALKLKEEGIENLAKSTKPEVAATVILSKVVENTRAELGFNIYDLNSWEYLADEFATRHQAGKHLVTGLDKLMRAGFNKSYRNSVMYVAMEALKMLFLFAGWMIGPIGTMMAIIFISSDADMIDYDEPGARNRRVRQQLVEALKNNKLDKDDITRLTDDIDVIDLINDEVNDRRQFISVVLDCVVPQARKNRDATVMQQQLESVANNDLFIKAAKLKIQ